ncbi:MAG: hypothetical protein AB1505_09950 [Candidatus Latescibacterota bacterium]
MPGAAASILLLVLALGCSPERDPVEVLQQHLERFPEYSVTLEDARVEEGAFADYFLRFRILTGTGQRVDGQDTLVYKEEVRDWQEVSQHAFSRYENYLGMVVASKTRDGQRTGPQQAYPPSYQYVGNPHYGFWGAGGFWQFYGQYALMRDLMGGWRVGRDDWEDYRRNRERGQPYHGPVQEGRPTFGSEGRVTQQTRPDFYQRHQVRHQRFVSRTQSRMGRSTTGSTWGGGK